MRAALASSIIIGFASQAAAQIVWNTPSIGTPIRLDDIHNVSSIAGTWSSGSQKVITGTGFCNPVDSTFTYPPTAGIGYSFTDDGYFEEALYRFTGNGTDPRCVVGVVQWQHGQHELLQNGSIVLHPFAQDGRQQVQDACAADSNVLRQFNQTTLFLNWRIFRDVNGNDKLHLFRFDGAPFPPMFRVSSSATMLPTQTLTNTSIGVQAQRKRSITGPWDLEAEVQKRSAAPANSQLALGAFFSAGLLSLGLLAGF